MFQLIYNIVTGVLIAALCKNAWDVHVRLQPMLGLAHMHHKSGAPDYAVNMPDGETE